ncbi:MAG: transketolase [Bdellovibrionota bacterium]
MKFSWPQGTPTSAPVRLALRQAILESIHLAESGHPGGSLSLVEILTSIFESKFQHSPENQEDPTRDRIVLSKGHGVPALYALYSFLGYFPAIEMRGLRKSGHFLQGHPDRLRYPLMEASTGSLGQGASIALGLALGLRVQFEAGELSRLPKVYCVLGDGESQEGQVWECLMSCGKFLPGNLIFVLDANKAQIDGYTEDVMNLEPIVDKVKSFGLDVTDLDGHDVEALKAKFNSIEIKPHAPAQFIVARTVKGKGVQSMEGVVDWHGKAPNKEELKKSLTELYASDDRVNGSLLEESI